MDWRKIANAALIVGCVMLGFLAMLVAGGLLYTTAKLALASTRGVYRTAEEGMRDRISKAYTGITKAEILYAGPNAFDGSQPHVWYVVGEVRAASRADGAELHNNGCEGLGLFFLETKRGWVQMSEGSFPALIGAWMDFFGLAGPGQPEPSTRWDPSKPARHCQSP